MGWNHSSIPNFDDITVEVEEWMLNFIPHFTEHVVISNLYPLLDPTLYWICDYLPPPYKITYIRQVQAPQWWIFPTLTSRCWVVCDTVQLVPIRFLRTGYGRMVNTLAILVGGERCPMEWHAFVTTRRIMKQSLTIGVYFAASVRMSSPYKAI